MRLCLLMINLTKKDDKTGGFGTCPWYKKTKSTFKSCGISNEI